MWAKTHGSKKIVVSKIMLCRKYHGPIRFLIQIILEALIKAFFCLKFALSWSKHHVLLHPVLIWFYLNSSQYPVWLHPIFDPSYYWPQISSCQLHSWLKWFLPPVCHSWFSNLLHSLSDFRFPVNSLIIDYFFKLIIARWNLPNFNPIAGSK